MEDKAKWVQQIAELLRQDPRSEVKDIIYWVQPKTEDEFVTVVFRNDSAVRIIVSADSLGAILKEITSYVYF